MSNLHIPVSSVMTLGVGPANLTKLKVWTILCSSGGVFKIETDFSNPGFTESQELLHTSDTLHFSVKAKH